MRYLRGSKSGLMAGVLLLAWWGLQFPASDALAGTSSKGYAQFSECPLARATITDCVYSLTTGGSFKIGKRVVPIVNPMTLQGGFEGAGNEIKFYGAEDGETLANTAQPVPGAFAGVEPPDWWPKFLRDWFSEEVEEGNVDVSATVELTGPTKGATNIDLNTTNFLSEEGTALGLPVKFHLESPLLGSNCYVGWNTQPVQINFTTGVDGQLKGSSGESSFNRAFTISTTAGGRLVSNSFASPRAEGCGGIFSFFIDPLVNSMLGTPSEVGENAATLEGKLQLATVEAVKAGGSR